MTMMTMLMTRNDDDDDDEDDVDRRWFKSRPSSGNVP